MKNKIWRLVLLFIFFSTIYLTSSYSKETGTIYLESNKEIVEKGDEIDIAVNIEDTNTAAFDFSLYFDSNKWEYISKLDNDKVEDDRIIYVWYDKNGGSSSKKGEIAKFKFKAKEDGLSTFSLDGNFYNQSGQKIQINFQEEQVKIGKENTNLQEQSEDEKGNNTQEKNSNLKVLRLDIEGMTPAFDTNNYEYYLNVQNNINNIEVLAITENPNASVEIAGNNNLKEGLNTIKVKVISEDKKEEKIYTIQVTKTKNLDLANTNLEILAIENVLLNPPFDINETKYSIEIAKDVSSLNILAVPENEKAKVEIIGNKELKEGNNQITIIVTAANGFSKKKYQIEVHKRNETEQVKYEEEQKEQAKKVEEAYKIERINSDREAETSKENKDNSKGIWIAVVVIVVLVMGRISTLVY